MGWPWSSNMGVFKGLFRTKLADSTKEIKWLMVFCQVCTLLEKIFQVCCIDWIGCSVCSIGARIEALFLPATSGPWTCEIRDLGWAEDEPGKNNLGTNEEVIAQDAGSWQSAIALGTPSQSDFGPSEGNIAICRSSAAKPVDGENGWYSLEAWVWVSDTTWNNIKFRGIWREPCCPNRNSKFGYYFDCTALPRNLFLSHKMGINPRIMITMGKGRTKCFRIHCNQTIDWKKVRSDCAALAYFGPFVNIWWR